MPFDPRHPSTTRGMRLPNLWQTQRDNRESWSTISSAIGSRVIAGATGLRENELTFHQHKEKSYAIFGCDSPDCAVPSQVYAR